MAERKQRPTEFEVPVDPPLPERLPDDASISEVKPLRYVSCLPFGRSEIERFVEQPLVDACRILFDKNVPTTLSSANGEDLARGDSGALFIDYGALSAANRRVAEAVGEIMDGPGFSTCIVTIPITAKATVSDVSEYAVTIAERFEPQEPGASRVARALSPTAPAAEREGGGRLTDVTRIAQGHVEVFDREELAAVVEAPLVPACQALWDKNIRPFMSSANALNAEDGRAWILLRYGDLSAENADIAGRVGRLDQLNAGLCYWLEIPVDADSTVAQVSEAATALAERFQPQDEFYAALSLTAEQIGTFLAGQLKGFDPDARTPAELAEYVGFTYDPATELFFRTETARLRHMGVEVVEVSEEPDPTD